MAISKYDKKFEYGKILTEGDLNGMVDAINLGIDGVNNAIETSLVTKEAIKTLEGLSDSTEAMKVLAGQVLQIEDNKKNVNKLYNEVYGGDAPSSGGAVILTQGDIIASTTSVQDDADWETGGGWTTTGEPSMVSSLSVARKKEPVRVYPDCQYRYDGRLYNSANVCIVIEDDSGNVLSYYNGGNIPEGGTANSFEFTTPANSAYIKLCCYYSNNLKACTLTYTGETKVITTGGGGDAPETNGGLLGRVENLENRTSSDIHYQGEKLSATNVKDALDELSNIVIKGESIVLTQGDIIASTTSVQDDADWETGGGWTTTGEPSMVSSLSVARKKEPVRVYPDCQYRYDGRLYNSANVCIVIEDDSGNVLSYYNGGNIPEGGTANSFEFTTPANSAYIKLCCYYSNNLKACTLTYTGETKVINENEEEKKGISSISVNGEKIEPIDGNVDIKISSSIEEGRSRLNIANASMRCDFCTVQVDNLNGKVTDMGCMIVDASHDISKQVVYGNKVDGMAGYGIICPQGQVDLKFYVPQKENGSAAVTLGFWINKGMLGESDFLIANQAGPMKNMSAKDIEIGVHVNFPNNIGYCDVTEELDGWYYFVVKILAEKSITTFKVAPRNVSGECKMNIHNFTALMGDVKIESNWEYPTLYQRFNSKLIGKSLCLTGDSNGGAGVGTWKRLSWAARLLGLKVYNATRGGWAMQGRAVSNSSDGYFGWLYNHNWRSKMLAVEADIYYFNQCTNDGYLYNKVEYDYNNHYYPSSVTLPDGSVKNSYGRFGDATIEEVAKVKEIYTTAFAEKLDSIAGVSGGLDQTWNGEVIRDILRVHMTTFGCLGAFIQEISEKLPKSLCVIDSTLQSIGVCNTILGGFSAEGISSSNRMETDKNGYVVYAPYLKNNVNSEGQVTEYISNGTLTGGEPITSITSSSTLSDGKNYSLYHYYAFKNFGKVVGTDTIDSETDQSICELVHQYYETSNQYGRCEPSNLLYLREDLIKNYMREKYLEAVKEFTKWCNVPFIDAGGFHGITRWNVGRVAGDAGHYNSRGMRALGIYIANKLNELVWHDDEEFAEIFDDYAHLAGID